MWSIDMDRLYEVISMNTVALPIPASSWSTYPYPRKLAATGNVYGKLRSSCFTMYMDSAIAKPVATDELYQDAVEKNVDYVFSNDTLNDADATLESTKQLLSLRDGHSIQSPSVIPVIQAPHREHLEDNWDFYSRFGQFALGGLQGFEPLEQVSVIKDVREYIGKEKDVHGFGIGTSLPVIKALREDPDLLDTFDISTPETAVKSGKIPDAALTQHSDFVIPQGDRSSLPNSAWTKAILLQINYLLSPHVDATHIEDAYHEQTGLQTVQDGVEAIDLDSRYESILAETPPDTATTAVRGGRATTLSDY